MTRLPNPRCCYGDENGECNCQPDRPPASEHRVKVDAAVRRARNLLGEDSLTAPGRLWHPWALDLADDVLLLAELLRRSEAALAAARGDTPS